MDKSNIYKKDLKQYEDGYYIPDFSFERKTQAFNSYLGFIVYLISLFTVFLGAIVPQLFISSLLKLESTFVEEYDIYLIFVIVAGGAIVAIMIM